MPYPAYSGYVPSDADWLGELPSRWQVRRLRFAALHPLKYGANEAAELEDPDLPRYIRITDVKSDGSLNSGTFRSLPEEVAAPYLLEEGDILLARSGATVGKSFQYSASWGKAAYAGYLIRFRPDKTIIDHRYAYYYFQTQCYWACINSTLIQATIQNFSAEKYNDLNLPLPVLAEQQQIANFLDYKTAQIDTLIAKKQELIEKLKEQRIAIITRAVTKGLDPNAPMVDSGIDWLGKVPEQWDIPALKMRYKVELGKMLDEKRISGNYLVHYLRNTDVQWDSINYENLPQMDIFEEEIRRYTILDSDVLVCEGGEVGRTAVVNTPPGVVGFQKVLHRLRPENEAEVPRFLFYTLFWAVHTRVFEVEGSSTISHLTGDQLRRYRFPQPPQSEQKKIADYLDAETEKIDRLTKMIETAVDRLTEYRTALITAATTGKIDVRNVSLGKSK